MVHMVMSTLYYGTCAILGMWQARTGTTGFVSDLSE
jgi:hypothetical protein